MIRMSVQPIPPVKHKPFASYLVAVKTTQPSFHSGSRDICDVVLFRRFDKNTSEETDQIRRMQEDVWLIPRHMGFKGFRQLLLPQPVLV